MVGCHIQLRVRVIRRVGRHNRHCSFAANTYIRIRHIPHGEGIKRYGVMGPGMLKFPATNLSLRQKEVITMREKLTVDIPRWSDTLG